MRNNRKEMRDRKQDKKRKRIIVSSLFVLLISSVCLSVTAQNPIIRDQFTADPTARVFNGKVYLSPSHDIFPPEGTTPRLVLHGRLSCVLFREPYRLD